MPHDRLVSLAQPSLTYDVSNLEISEQEAQALYKQQVLVSMSNSDLVRIIINRPTVILKKSGINTGFEAQYVHNPLMNMYFLKDQSITTPKGHIMCRMNSSQRAPEVDIIEACYEQLGEPAVYRVKGEDSYLEGGDYIPFGTISLIGQGLRTNQKAIDVIDSVWIIPYNYKTRTLISLPTPRNTFTSVDSWISALPFSTREIKLFFVPIFSQIT